MLVYGDYCQILDCYFDRIKNLDGTYRSPKKYEKVELVKNPLSQKLESLPWKIRVQIGISLWSGLENKDLVFWLINSHSEDFAIIKTLVKDNVRIIKDEDKAYAGLKNIMVSKINNSSIDIQK